METIDMKRGTLPPQGAGHGIMTWMLVIAVLLSAVAGVLMSAGEAGIRLPIPSGGGEPAVVVSHEEDSEEEEEEEPSEPAEEETTEMPEEDAAQEDTENSSSQGFFRRRNGTQQVKITIADETTKTRLRDLSVRLLEGHDNPDGETVYETVTNDLGQALFEAESGYYTLVWDTSDLMEDYENITIGGGAGEGMEYIRDSDSSYTYWKAVLPKLAQGQGFITMEWRGADDLDLVVFNAQTKEYIGVPAPMDSMGSFLFVDKYSGSPGIEVVKLMQFTESVVYTPFVRDGNHLLSGSYSAMEANGVRISVYDANGLIYRAEADQTERAALWNPCYVYEGKVYTDGSYIYEPKNYSWAAYEKSPY